MSVVIVGGNDRMVCQYKDVCKDYGCRAKVFTPDGPHHQKETWYPGFDDSVYRNSSSQNGKFVPPAKQNGTKFRLCIPALTVSLLSERF